ncbi:efflux RND transporter permease subunit [Myxococcota bacterium]|nr:efflux RND transporter permease subunit [Myxococcota bacterium]
MNRAIAWFATNSVAANLLMGLIVVAGVMALLSVPQKQFPDVDINVVTVSVEYLGAAPEEVEQGVCIRIEEAIDGIEGIEELRSVAAEGACNVQAELMTDTDPIVALDDIKNRVDAIDTFPEEAEKPIIEKLSMQRMVMDIAVSGHVGPRSLYVVTERIRDEIAALPNITQVEIALDRPFEMSIEISEESLRRYGLRFDNVVSAVQRSSLDLPGGRLKTSGGEILLRTKGQAYLGDDFEDLVLLTRPDGTRVTLGEVATVNDGFEDTDVEGRFDGVPTLLVQVYRVGTQDVIGISNNVKQYVEQLQSRLPEGVSVTIWEDGSMGLRGRIDTLLRTGSQGFLLVLIVLALFLRFRVAFWVTLGVPIAFLGGFWTWLPLGLSIDVISLFGFICVLGILVDDAVVVGENIYNQQIRLKDRLRGAIVGTQQVATPVVFGVLTTVAAFSPMLFVDGMMGDINSVMGSVVIACLLFSLVESQWILPAHLAHGQYQSDDEVSKAPKSHSALSAFAQRWRKIQNICAGTLEHLAQVRYRGSLQTALTWRYATLAVAVSSLILAMGVIASGRMGFSFFPPIEADFLAARLTMSAGTPADVTKQAVERIERAAYQLAADLDPVHLPEGETFVQHVLSSVGSQPLAERGGGPDTPSQNAGPRSHVGEVAIRLLEPEKRPIPNKDLAAHWRKLVSDIPDTEQLVYASSFFSMGSDIDIQLRGADVETLVDAAERVKQELATYAGVVDISDSFRAGKEEIKLDIEPSAEPLGLTLADLGKQVRQAFYGEEAQRIQRGRDDVRVMVRYPERQRRSVGDLSNLRIRTQEGMEVPFGTVARAELGRGFSSIKRTNRMRVVDVTADVDRSVTTENEVLANFMDTRLPTILADYPGITANLAGASEEQRKSLSGLMRSYLVAIFVIYALLAVPLRSYVQPLLIMCVIPFGLVGAIGGHILLGPIKAMQSGIWNPAQWNVMDLSFMSIIGIVALSGVVVNASLVLVHYVNQRREEGDPIEVAVVSAGTSRFRPIILTSLTTFVGLTPLMLERSIQAQFLIPMAVSLAFGVLFATFVTLFVIPCGYLILEDLRQVRTRRSKAPGSAQDSLAHQPG